MGCVLAVYPLRPLLVNCSKRAAEARRWPARIGILPASGSNETTAPQPAEGLRGPSYAGRLTPVSAGPRATAPPRPAPDRATSVRAVGTDLAAWPVLALVCVASLLTLTLLGTRLTFFNDDWYFLLQRPGLTADSLLTPHNGHLSVVDVLLYKGLVELFGLNSQLPFRLVLALAVAAVGIMVYLLVSARAGRFLGLVAATLVVFLGPAWEDLLFFASIGLVGSLATGLGALVALERDTPRREAVACALLVCSIGFSDAGLAFVVAATIALALRRRPRQLWVAAVPIAVFAMWWLSYGSDAPSSVSGSNVEHVPRYTIDAVSTGLTSIAGLNHGDAATVLRRGHFLLLVAGLALVVWWLRGGRPRAAVFVFLGGGLAFWGLAGANYIPGREPSASRYQLIDAVLLILIGAELFRPGRLRPRTAAVIGGLALLALASNVDALAAGFRFMREQSAYVRTDLGALELARGRASGDVRLYETVAHNPFLSGVSARRYYAESDAHGSPPFSSPEEIASAPPRQRQAADHILAAAYGMAPRSARAPASRRACRRLAASSAGAGSETGLSARGDWITNLGKDAVALGVRRFAPASTPAYIGFLPSHSTARVAAPHDAVAGNWHLLAKGAEALEVCAR